MSLVHVQMGVLVSVWHYDMSTVCFNLFDILKMCGERKTHNPPSGVSHKVFHCPFTTLCREPSTTTLGVVVVVVGIVSGGLWTMWWGDAYHCHCGHWGRGCRHQWWAVDDLMGCLPVVVLTVMLGVCNGSVFFSLSNQRLDYILSYHT